MREIKFRGKRADNGQWIEGDLVQTKPGPDGVCICWIKERTNLGLGALSTPTSSFHEVRPETVGQYIGVEDVSGREIFEGNICLREDGQKCVIKFYANSWCMDMSDFYPRCKEGWCESMLGTPRLEIIGNIHDQERKG